jgi:hypothetical protein
MRELVQIETVSEHGCGQPTIERWEVLEPISGRWSWMRVFGCCSQVVVDIDDSDGAVDVKRAA